MRKAHLWSGPPLALQITALLLGGLVVAQLVTLALTLLLPPAPEPQYELQDIAAVLSGSVVEGASPKPLERVLQARPPEPKGRGWLTAEHSRRDLAQLMGRNPSEVRLYFYTPLPFAGTARAPQRDEGRGMAVQRGPALPGSDEMSPTGFMEVDQMSATGFVHVNLRRSHGSRHAGAPEGGGWPRAERPGPAPGPGGQPPPGFGRRGSGAGGADGPRAPVPGGYTGSVPWGEGRAAAPRSGLVGSEGRNPERRGPELHWRDGRDSIFERADARDYGMRSAWHDTEIFAAGSERADARDYGMRSPWRDSESTSAAFERSDGRDASLRAAWRDSDFFGHPHSGTRDSSREHDRDERSFAGGRDQDERNLAGGRGRDERSVAGGREGKEGHRSRHPPPPADSPVPPDATASAPLEAAPATQPESASNAVTGPASANPAPRRSAVGSSAPAVGTTATEAGNPGGDHRRPEPPDGPAPSPWPSIPESAPAGEAAGPPTVLAQAFRSETTTRRFFAEAGPAAPPASAASDVAPVPAETRHQAAGTPRRAVAAAGAASKPAEEVIPLAPAQRGLFGLAPAPFVEGDFIAATQLQDGTWAVVQPAPEPFPNTWQRRVLLWFLIAAAVVGPLGWLFSRRLVRPLSGFAAAAEQLGRDPTAPILAVEGPAEVGRAAQAFNRMQSRLRSFVDDRTAMIGAISHDLRTPLTRMRFRIEDAPDELREGMLHEVDEMERMINSVLAFIRDASEPGSRERLDLSSIVEDVVEDAVFVGKKVILEKNEKAPVEVDPIGMRRLLDNLIENAVKYGERASVRLFTDDKDAVAEVTDSGPGLPDEELERVFQPFYRSRNARESNRQGSGLGLAVCRSIARAHGGDVDLQRGQQGLVARVRLPLAWGVAHA